MTELQGSCGQLAERWRPEDPSRAQSELQLAVFQVQQYSYLLLFTHKSRFSSLRNEDGRTELIRMNQGKVMTVSVITWYELKQAKVAGL